MRATSRRRPSRRSNAAGSGRSAPDLVGLRRSERLDRAARSAERRGPASTRRPQWRAAPRRALRSRRRGEDRSGARGHAHRLGLDTERSTLMTGSPLTGLSQTCREARYEALAEVVGAFCSTAAIASPGFTGSRSDSTNRPLFSRSSMRRALGPRPPRGRSPASSRRRSRMMGELPARRVEDRLAGPDSVLARSASS